MYEQIIKVLVSLSDIWDTFGHYRNKARLLVLMLVLTSFLDAFSIGMLLPVIEIIVSGEAESTFAKLITRFMDGSEQKDQLVLTVYIFLALVILKNIFIYLKNRVHADLSFGLRGFWMKELMTRYLRSNYSYIIENKQGVLVNNVVVEAEKAQFCLKFLVQFISSVLLALFMVVVLFMVSWEITLSLLLVVLLITFISKNTIGSYSTRIGSKKIKYAREVGNLVSESIAGIKQVKTLGLEDKILGQVFDTVNKYMAALGNFRVYSAIPQSVSEVVTVFFLVITVNYIVVFTDVEIADLVPIVAIFVVVGNRISVQAGMLVNSSMQVLSHVESLRLVYGIIKEDMHSEDMDGGVSLDCLNSDIQFEDVSFDYNNDHRVFEKINLVIPKNRFVFFVGGSGTGKSTLVDMLLRLNKPTDGRITFGGNDIQQYNIREWRSNIGYVSQDVMLFNKSIMENVREGNQFATDDEIVSVCKRVNAHDFISDLPDGYSTEVGDRGVKLSGGQRQRIVLARTLLSDPKILIFDEATSALDEKLESQIVREIKCSSNGKTIIYITHRLSTVVHADLIYKIENGTVVEQEALID